MTTSIPEAPGSGRTWDYRYCWLRDAYYVLGALRLLGHFEERESFVNYLLNIAGETPRPRSGAALPRRRHGRSRRADPGRTGRASTASGRCASATRRPLHAQHDIFGEMVLALAPDLPRRPLHARSARPRRCELVERLARKAIAVAGTPDAGIWEYRTEWKPQTFSSLMCWAAADRMAQVAARHRPAPGSRVRQRAAAHPRRDRGAGLEPAKQQLRRQLRQRAISTRRCCRWCRCASCRPTTRACAAPSTPSRSELGHATAGCTATSSTTASAHPSVAFIICTFWLVEALAACGRADEASAVLEPASARRSRRSACLSEDYDTADLRMWGNFPQAYSHVGLIHAAFAASPRWSEMISGPSI